jgi:hypothetical protein
MRQIFDNLLYFIYLDYETGLDPVHRYLPYLNPEQFSKEQFDYFGHLCVWLIHDL